jgi:D-3-phosphoglycerate dehydrogenase
MGPRILHLNLPPVPEALARERLAPIGADLHVADCKTSAEVIEAAAGADGIIGAALGRFFDPATIAALPRLRHISMWSGSTDDLEIGAFTDAGVVISFAADACTDEVADHGMAMMLALTRRLPHWDRLTRVRQGSYTNHDEVIATGRPTPRLSTLTCGSIGFGRAGRALALRARAFGMRLVAHDPFLPPDAGAELGVELLSKDDVLAQSDVLHVLVPNQKGTKHVIGADELARMKPTAYLVNTSARSDQIDDQALHRALLEGRLAGAGLDVIGPAEDGVPNPLLALDSVLLSPHIAHVSDQSYEMMQHRVLDDVVRFWTGQWPDLIANPAVKDRVTLPTAG